MFRVFYMARIPQKLPGQPLCLPVTPPHIAYAFADAIDPLDGKRYRYTGRVEEPALTKKEYLPGYKRFVMKRALTSAPPPRYGITYDDISTRADRDYWIAGSSLKVIDLETKEVIAERVGYLYDAAQGDRSGGSQPWLRAASNSCPSFGTVQAVTGQLAQAAIFVEKVLHLRREKQKGGI